MRSRHWSGTFLSTSSILTPGLRLSSTGTIARTPAVHQTNALLVLVVLVLVVLVLVVRRSGGEWRARLCDEQTMTMSSRATSTTNTISPGPPPCRARSRLASTCMPSSGTR